ncbi:hypothetical protein T439DRAFT_328081 [Meredithblackwellia eburnea MCA 4105]
MEEATASTSSSPQIPPPQTPSGSSARSRVASGDDLQLANEQPVQPVEGTSNNGTQFSSRQREILQEFAEVALQLEASGLPSSRSELDDLVRWAIEKRQLEQALEESTKMQTELIARKKAMLRLAPIALVLMIIVKVVDFISLVLHRALGFVVNVVLLNYLAWGIFYGAWASLVTKIKESWKGLLDLYGVKGANNPR